MNDSGTSLPSSSADASDNPPTNVRWNILFLLMAYSALFHFNRNSIAVAGNGHIMKDYGIDATSMGMVYSSYLFLYTLFMLPGGWLLDKIGPKRALLVVGFGSAILVPLTGLLGYLIPASADGSAAGRMLLVLCLLRATMGIISAPFHPGAARAISFWMPFPARARANGMVTGAAVIGAAFVYFVFGYMMDIFGWPRAFLVAGGVTLATALVWMFYATDFPKQHAGTNAAERHLLTDVNVVSNQTADLRDSLVGLMSMFRNRSLVLLTVSYAAYSYVQYLFFYWVEFYLKDILKLSPDASRLYSTIITLAMAVGMIYGGWLADVLQARFGGWRGRAITPICAMVTSAVLLMAGVFNTDLIWVITCFSLAMASLGISEATFWVTGVELGGRRGGLSGAFLNAGGNMGGILSPVITPIIGKMFSWHAGLCVASVICLLGAGLWFWIDPYERKDVEI